MDKDKNPVKEQPKPKTLNDLSVKDLKVMVYDLNVQLRQIDAQLKAVNNAIVEKTQKGEQ